VVEVCGDGIVNNSGTEACDDGGESAACDADCTVAVCGDSTVNAMAGETCDDGPTISGDGCDALCVV
jgi:cysteine-rich repeat protein